MSNVAYTGFHSTTFSDLARDAGGCFEFEIRHLNGEKVTTAEFSLSGSDLSLSWNGQSVKCLVDLIHVLESAGVNHTPTPTGCSEDGNVTNAVLGDRNIYAKCFYLGISFSEWVGKDNSVKHLQSRKSVTVRKNPRVNAMKIDNRLMRPSTGKSVWNQEYLAAKKINEKEFCQKYGRANVYADLKVLTVTEFETRYGIA